MNGREIEKVLVLQLGGIGDLVLSTPALNAIRQSFKASYIGLLVISRSADLIKNCPYIDDLFVFDIYYTNLISLFKSQAIIKVWKTIRQLRRLRFDMVINLENISSWAGAFKMAVLFWLIGAKYRVGRDTDGKGFFLNLKVKDSRKDSRHELDANLDVARAIGAHIQDIRPEVFISEEDKGFILDFLSQNGISDKDLLIGFNPGAFRLNRRWFEKCWAQLAERLIKEYGCKIVITGHRSEQRMIGEIVRLSGDKRLITATNLTLKQLAALIERLRLFITNDSGPMHIAAAVQAPLIAIFGAGEFHKFSPQYSQAKFKILRKDIDCRQSCNDKFNCASRRCMELITVEDVMQAVREILG